MQIRNVVTIFRKEVTDTLRDRRTLIFMMLVPLVAIPALILGMSSLMVRQISKVEKEESEIVIQGAEYLPRDLFDELVGTSGLTVRSEAEFAGGDIKEHLQQGEIQALVVVEQGFATRVVQEQSASIEILYDEAEMQSEVAERRVRGALKGYRERVVERRMEGRGLSGDLLTPFSVTSTNVAPLQKIVGKEFGSILPYVIIIMCFMGAMYPAIDLAAGEKERGTLETLLVSPATRGEFVVGKYLVILLTGVVAALLSLGSLVFSLNYIVQERLQQLTQALSFELNVGSVALVFLIILPLAGIFAGILLSVSIFARSFKEAQSYITALNMAIILPAFVSLLPGVKIEYKMALIPVINASLIIKEAISGSVQWNYVLVALASNTILAVLALLFCRKWFERESVLFRM